MFTSQTRIDSKTGPDDLGRFEYLQALVTEFQDTDRQGVVFKLVKTSLHEQSSAFYYNSLNSCKLTCIFITRIVKENLAEMK